VKDGNCKGYAQGGERGRKKGSYSHSLLRKKKGGMLSHFLPLVKEDVWISPEEEKEVTFLSNGKMEKMKISTYR